MLQAQNFNFDSAMHASAWSLPARAAPMLPQRTLRKLSLAVRAQAAAGQSQTVHVVKVGETLAAIANQYGISVLKLKEANKAEFYARDRVEVRLDHERKKAIIKTDIIHPGQQLLVPHKPTEAVRTTKAATKQAPTSKAATAKATTSTTQVLVPPVPVAKASGWSPALLGGGAAGLLLVAGVLRMLVRDDVSSPTESTAAGIVAEPVMKNLAAPAAAPAASSIALTAAAAAAAAAAASAPARQQASMTTPVAVTAARTSASMPGAAAARSHARVAGLAGAAAGRSTPAAVVASPAPLRTATAPAPQLLQVSAKATAPVPAPAPALVAPPAAAVVTSSATATATAAALPQSLPAQSVAIMALAPAPALAAVAASLVAAEHTQPPSPAHRYSTPGSSSKGSASSGAAGSSGPSIPVGPAPAAAALTLPMTPPASDTTIGRALLTGLMAPVSAVTGLSGSRAEALLSRITDINVVMGQAEVHAQAAASAAAAVSGGGGAAAAVPAGSAFTPAGSTAAARQLPPAPSSPPAASSATASATLNSVIIPAVASAATPATEQELRGLVSAAASAAAALAASELSPAPSPSPPPAAPASAPAPMPQSAPESLLASLRGVFSAPLPFAEPEPASTTSGVPPFESSLPETTTTMASGSTIVVTGNRSPSSTAAAAAVAAASVAAAVSIPSSIPASSARAGPLPSAALASALQLAQAAQPSPPVPRYDPYTDANILSLKAGLLDVAYGTARGVRASADERARVEEFVTALEARNPFPAPTDAVSVLEGRWKLVYTSSSQTLLLLNALDSIPLVDIGDVYQVIDSKAMVATNMIDVALPVPVSLRAEAGLEPRTPRAFKVRFTKLGLDTYIATPQLLSALEMPDSLEVLGTRIDLTPLRTLVLNPVNSGIAAAQGLFKSAVSPEFAVERPLPGAGMGVGGVNGSGQESPALWMLTTYLDESLRISRDDSGRVFVMLKDVAIPRQPSA